MSGLVRKPLWLTALATVLLLNTVSMPLQVMILFGHPLTETQAIWAKLTDHNRAVMLLSPLAALGAYRVCRWGWWAVMVLFSAALLNNAALLPYDTAVSPAAVLLSSGLIVCAGAWLLQPRVMQLFRQRQLQWWKTPPRYAARLPVELARPDNTRLSPRLVNISRTGIYVRGDHQRLAPGDVVSVSIRFERRVVRCLAAVVRKAAGSTTLPAGYGLRFQKVAVADRLWLRTRLERHCT